MWREKAAKLLTERKIALALSASLLIVIAVATLVIAGVIGDRPPPYGDSDFELEGAAFEPAQFRDLEGWRLDDADEALGAFLRSCERMARLADEAPVNPRESLGPGAPQGLRLAGAAGDWRGVCADGARIHALPYADASARASGARAFFESRFRPVKIMQRLRPVPGGKADGRPPRLSGTGRFTAYFEPVYEASRTRTAVFSAPVYARPHDLVTVDLGRFRPDLAGERIAGRVVDGVLDPYPDHAAINAGALAGRARVLAWMRPTDLFFLQIQGSGRLSLPGEELRIGYDGANGRPYTAIGRTLIAMGALSKETVSMQTIGAWLDQAPDGDARKVRESNQSFVFFRALDTLADPDLGPLGAEGVQLTPGRSLAVDPRFTPFGAPVWVSIEGDAAKDQPPFRRLLIAQDSGGAIKGPVRGDLFIGAGESAGAIAGGFNSMGEMHLLLPMPLADRLLKEMRA